MEVTEKNSMKTDRGDSHIKALLIAHTAFREGFNELKFSEQDFEFEERKHWTQLKIRQKLSRVKGFKVIHYFWGRASAIELLFFRLLGKKIFLHFIGSDVLMVLNSKSKQIKNRWYIFLGINILTVHINLSNELGERKIPSRVIPFINRKLYDCEKKLPERFSVLVYMPEGKEEFYGMGMLKKVFTHFPQIDFVLFPNSKEFGINNVKTQPMIAYDKVPELIANHSLFIRIPEHDGLPNTVIEALMCARNVIWSFKHPFVYQVRSTDALIEILNELNESPTPNVEGKNYVLKKYNHKKLAEKYSKIWKGAF